MKKHFVGFYNYSVYLTLVGLLVTVFGMTQCINGHYKIAISCLIVSGICDAFDGIIARTRHESTLDERNYGIQLDSLCDMVCFGLYPALICYMLGVRGWFGLFCIFFFVLCALIRLAYFNVLALNKHYGVIDKTIVTKPEEETAMPLVTEVEDAEVSHPKKHPNRSYYHGLPVTAITGILPVFFFLQFVVGTEALLVILHIMLLATGFLYVLDFHFPKPSMRVIILLVIALLAFIVIIFAYTHFQLPPTNVDPSVIANTPTPTN